MHTKKKIYFADDDFDDRLLLKNALTAIDSNLEFFEADNGDELLTILNTVDLKNDCMIILDMNMPKLNGLETLKQLGANSSLQVVPAIMITTSQDPNLFQTAKRLGAVDCFTKPVNMDDLLVLARKILLRFSRPDQAGCTDLSVIDQLNTKRVSIF
ncbi:response regulator [Dyadobacter subterraneus]|uniref:Response regulator n=1 Tax=Dyadobacter subterraneus TaxID=2773304 RepID=A0ABR9WFA1_9BACT|nr:response regulator [Dyadobacter subterraneus]MBE9463809.1 response regulator [Dyadobacter subterraneus]